MKWPRLLVSAVVAALVVWFWTILHPSPEKLIRKQLDGLARAASFAAGDGTLAKMAGAARLAGFFSTNIEVEINGPGRMQHHLSGVEEVQQAALASRASSQSLNVTFPDVSVLVGGDHQSAVADLTLQARFAGVTDADSIVQELKVTFRKIDGRWLIVKVETVRTLSLLAGSRPECF